MRQPSRLIVGDCIAGMRLLPTDSIDAIVTDPPYGLGFMGSEWDDPSRMNSFPPSAAVAEAEGRHPFPKTGAGQKAVIFEGRAFQVWCAEWAAEALRVLKPGGHLLAFGGSRTYHRMASGIEDAGFEIRDQVMWLYGQGFPKSLDVAKAIDKAEGVKGEFGEAKSAAHQGWIDRGRIKGENSEGHPEWATGAANRGDPEAVDEAAREYLPASEDAQAWKGWGTALKPAHEPIVLARKPLAGSVAANVLEHGTGALNIDASRIRAASDDGGSWERSFTRSEDGINKVYGKDLSPPGEVYYRRPEAGRWPANVLLSHHPDCVEVGTRTISSGKPPPPPMPSLFDPEPEAPVGTGGIWSEGNGVPVGPQYGDEEIPVYECADDCPIRILDDQSGETTGRAGGPDYGRSETNVYGYADSGTIKSGEHYGDTGGASRFFKQPAWGEDEAARFWYQPKASTAERNRGLHESVLVSMEWENEARKVRLRVDTAPSPPRVTDESGATDGTEWSTLLFGKPHTDPSLLAIRSTTGTRTNSTIASEILNCLTRSLTNGSIPDANSGAGNGGNPADDAESSSASARITTNGETVSLPGVGPVASGTPLRVSVAVEGGKSTHPTVKPIELMRYLVRLVTPPGGVVLDPFLGSGTTAIAAEIEGFTYIGCEKSPHYADIALSRLAYHGSVPIVDRLKERPE